MAVINVRSAFEAPCGYLPTVPAHFTEQYHFIFYALMAWPNDPDRSKQYVQRCMATQYASLEDVRNVLPVYRDNQHFKYAKEALWEFLGKWDGVLNLPSAKELDEEFCINIHKGYSAGITLCLLYYFYKLHGNKPVKLTSLTNIWKWLEHNGSTWFSISSTKDVLDENWEKYKPVAHLWAASFLFDQIKQNEYQSDMAAVFDQIKDDIFGQETYDTEKQADIIRHMNIINDRLKYLFVYAYHFQEFGIKFKVKHSSKTLLDKGSMYFLEDVPDWGIDFPEFKFPDELVESFNNFG